MTEGGWIGIASAAATVVIAVLQAIQIKRQKTAEAKVAAVTDQVHIVAQALNGVTGKLMVVEGKIVEVGANIDGRLTQLLLSEKAASRLEGADDERKRVVAQAGSDALAQQSVGGPSIAVVPSDTPLVAPVPVAPIPVTVMTEDHPVRVEIQDPTVSENEQR